MRVCLAVLALERVRTLERSELAEAIWPVDLPPTWASALRTVLTQVRGVLNAAAGGGRTVVGSGGRVGISADLVVTTDVNDAMAAIEAADAARVQGDPCAAMPLARAAADALGRGLLPFAEGDLVELWRERVGVARRRALACVVAAAIETGAVHEAVAAASEAVAMSPYDDAAQRELMAAHVAAGNRAEALSSYTRFRVRLRDELGVDPSPETVRDYVELLTLADEATPARAMALPATLARLREGPVVGRRDELDRLRTWWADVRDGNGGVVVVNGEGGVGKSRLAAELAAVAAADGATVLHGRCDDHLTTVFQPFTEAARAAAGDADGSGASPI